LHADLKLILIPLHLLSNTALKQRHAQLILPTNLYVAQQHCPVAATIFI
jgi:hypothetical protein